jgi:hypothetical protein
LKLIIIIIIIIIVIVTAVKTSQKKTFLGPTELSLPFEKLIIVMKNPVFWDVTPCGSCKEPTFRRNVSPPSPE